MRADRRPLLLGAAFALLFAAGVAPEAPLGVTLVPDARAIIGMALTPLSDAGVARRTTRRVVYTEARVATAATASAAAAGAAAAALPPHSPSHGPAGSGPGADRDGRDGAPTGLRDHPIGEVEYYNSAPGVYYRAAFQGNNLVYVAAQP